ncbi:putative thioesterase [Oceanococcus atlanticus]|uniref:Putative thioesterase n=1 Tax=Oceanococcus atlanticus TaxID=1317117 RepID=A0A1Y1SEJ1_9GAMM|nr:hotdog fold thioesterase [Oceanococcus atlanticus]ORE87103.1 putative thioesterase [Oceanococcus atlanticus]RZO86849.1 MAG: hotdog fold thioesterase [Oceanococcus sp.]
MMWHTTPNLDEMNARSKGTILELTDIRFSEVGDDYLCATMPVDERTFQPFRLLHGGASVVLAESVGSTAANLCLDPKTHYAVGLDINANHVRAATSGRVTATTRAVHIGRTTQVWAIDIVDDQGRTVCVSRLTMAVVAHR